MMTMSKHLLLLSLIRVASAVPLQRGVSKAGEDYFFIDGQDSPIIGTKSDVYVRRDANNCTQLIHNYNPHIHKPKYRVGVYASEGEEVAFQLYNLTFSRYLAVTAGQRFDPPLEFDMVAGSMTELMDMKDQLDFTFASSAVSSCMMTEYDTQPLVTVIMRREAAQGHQYDLDLYGGVIFTKADNYRVNSMQDLKDKTIGAGSITAMGGGQTQFHEMVKHGLSYVQDPKQVVFTKDETLVVTGVLEGDFEIGFARTDQIERHKDNNGNHLDPATFKVINAQTHSLQNGQLFPFKSSTSLHPEWPVTALKHVSVDVAEAVQEALLALNHHASALDFQQNLRCDTTPALAQLAKDCKTYGALTGFRHARNYFSVRTKQEAAGLLNADEQGNWRCIRGQTLYHDITCPKEHYKMLEKDFNRSCELMGLECPHDYECYCKPCIHRSLAVDVFSYDEITTSINTSTTRSIPVIQHSLSCSKSTTCATVEQTGKATFRIVDHMERTGATIVVTQHMNDHTKNLTATQVEGLPWTYQFRVNENTVGQAIVEIAIGGVEIFNSPIHVSVVQRRCEVHGMVANENGDCKCRSSTIGFKGRCIDNSVFAAVGSVGGFLLLLALVFTYYEYKNRKSDEMWKVDINELHFADPVEVIGQGSYGVVLMAEYRGTKVAIKQALNTTNKPGSSSKAGGSGLDMVQHGHDVSSSLNSIRGSAKIAPTSPSVDGPTEEFADEMMSRDEGLGEDIEIGDISPGYRRRSSVGTSRRYSGGTLDFLGMNARRFPWMKKENPLSRFNETILTKSKSTSKSISRKTLHDICCPWFNEKAQRQRAFEAEMRVLSLLRHPCITTVMGAVMTRNNPPMMVMEYMDYGSLHDLLRNKTLALTGDIISQIVRSVGQGLRYLHGSTPPILHGDMKSRNILIDSRFRAKLCDFGLSRKKKKQVAGTPYWLAPEYLRGETDYDTKCDIYSVGIIFYEIYSRKNPYEFENFEEVLQQICDKRVNKRPNIPGNAPPKMVDLMKKCWNNEKNFRPSAHELDLTLIDFAAEDLEPLTIEQQSAASRKRRSGDMLYELFPRHIADALKLGKKVEAENHELVTVVFSDIVRFTDISQELEPMKVSTMLDNLYLAFDKIARRHNVFKVETIGDAYMGVTNLNNKQEHNHVKCAAEFAIDMIREASQILIDLDHPEKGYINIRVGFHSGPVASNVIGSMNPRYGLFGDTVNTASRMESNSIANRILCSERSCKLLKEQAPNIPIHKRGTIKVKGKGEMKTYWIGGKMDLSISNEGAARCAANAHTDTVDKSASFGRGTESLGRYFY